MHKASSLSGYAKYFDDKNKFINLVVIIKKVLKVYNAIWDGVNSLIKKEFDSKPVHNNKYTGIKTRSYNGKINTNFHDNNIFTSF